MEQILSYSRFEILEMLLKFIEIAQKELVYDVLA